MPMYEYLCPTCGKSFEKLLPIAQADARHVCPACGGQETQRKLSTFAVSGGSMKSTIPAAPPRPFT